MIRNSTAVWHGDTLHGSGALTTQSNALDGQPYSYKTRFLSEDGKAGTNPEESLLRRTLAVTRWRLHSH